MKPVRRLTFVAAIGLAGAGCAELVTDITEYGSVEVTAMRRNGDPIRGTEVLLYIGQGARSVGVTDSAGRYRFEFVPPESYGVYAAPPDGYSRLEELTGGPSTAQVDGITVEAGGQEEVAFVYLKEGPGSITVTAREPDGTAVADAVLSLYSPAGTMAEQMAGALGEVSFTDVPFGNWGVRVAPPEMYLDEGELVRQTDGIIIEDGSAEKVAFPLERCLGTRRAQVRTPGGAPVPDFPVRLYQGEGTRDAGPTSDEGERAFGPLLCRTFGVGLLSKEGWEYDEGPGRSWVDGLKVSRDSDRVVSFTVASCAGTIIGRVRNPQGQPLAGARLTLFAGEGDLEVVVTGADGSGTLNPYRCLEHGVRLTPPPGYATPAGRGSDFYDGIDVRGRDPVEVAFTAERCIGDVAVSVGDQNGDPVPGAVLFLFTGDGDVAQAATKADGRITFVPPRCGVEYGVRVDPPQGYTVGTGRGFRFLDGLAPAVGSTTNVTFTLLKG